VTFGDYFEIPLWILGISGRKYTDRLSCSFSRMLLTEKINGLQCCSFKGVNYSIAHHINFNRLPLGTEGMLGNSHFNSTSANTLLLIFHCIILWRLSIKERTQRLPEKARETLLVQGICVKMPGRIPKDVRRSCHLQQECKW
jgi:hypothetical protein